MNAIIEEQIPYLYPAGSEKYPGPPQEGREAWFDTQLGLDRELRIFRGGEWVPDPDSTDEGL